MALTCSEKEDSPLCAMSMELGIFTLSFSMHSFVKKNRKFWADASHLIKLLIYKQLQPSLLTVFSIKKEFPSIFIEIGLGGIGSSQEVFSNVCSFDGPRERLQKEDEENQQKITRGLQNSAFSESESNNTSKKEENLSFMNDEKLRCVICICRHGDRYLVSSAVHLCRTPKQKLKFKVTSPTLLDLFN